MIESQKDDPIEGQIQDDLSDLLEDDPSDMTIILTERERIGVPQLSSNPTIEEKEAIVQQVKARIKTMLDEDIPFFTMDRIRDVHEQVQKCMAQGGKGDVFVEGLDGIVVRFRIHVGRKYDWAGAIRYVVFKSFIYNTILTVYSVKPVIEYASLHQLTSDKWVKHLNPELAYCNLVVYHKVLDLDKEKRKAAKARYASVPREVVERDFDRYLHEWMTSEQCTQLKSLHILREEASRIKKIVAFACGSITHFQERSRGRSCYQHGLIKTLRDMLIQARHDDINLTREQREEQIQCFIQDPAYTDIDRKVLENDYEIATILENPVGFLEVDDSTLVISFSPNVPVRQVVVDIAKPAVMIWDRVWSNLDET